MDVTEEKTIDLYQLSVLLTVLDKEAYNAKYFERMIPEGEEEDRGMYVDTIRTIQSVFISQISEENIDGFLEKNPHLKDLFGVDLLEEYEDFFW